MFKRLMKRLAKLRNSLRAMTIVHFVLLATAATVFTTLACSGRLRDKTISVVPAEYQELEVEKATALEQALRTKSTDVVGLITFDQVKHIVVLHKGFEKDRIAPNAEVEEMVALAKAANIPVTNVPPTKVRGSFTIVFWVGLLGLIAWTLAFLFLKRDEFIPSRAEAFWEWLTTTLTAYVERKHYDPVKFYLTLWFIAAGILVTISYSALENFGSPKGVMPANYGAQKQTWSWQLERLLKENPKAFERAVAIEGTNAVSVVLNMSTSKPKKANGDPEDKDAEFVLARITRFPETGAGKDAYDHWVNELKAAQVPVKTVQAELKDGWYDRMGEELKMVHGLVIFIMIVLLAFILSRWQSAQAKQEPKVKRGGAAVGGGAGSGTGQKVAKDAKKITLDDVAGCDEAVAKFRLVVEWMRDAKAFEHYGAKLPNGVLLYGPPGTGKTLLARAVAGEVDGNFFHASASEFIEMYVGVGARRVRDFFDKGKAAHRRTGKISVLFLDEIDAVGKKRSDHGTSGDGERDQTVNQLLTCIQGFDQNSGCLLIAATNRPETLDEGLKRSGRFDFKIEVSKPDRKGRQAIFRVHGKKADLEPGVDREELYAELSKRAHDFTGADIELAVNEALTRAAKRNAHLFTGKTDDEIAKMPRAVSRKDFNEGVDYVLYGEMIKSRVRSDAERWATSVHEIGHATIPTVLRGDPVSRITIVMTTKSLGLMESHTEEERYGWSKQQFLQRIKTMLAGRAAEELIANEVSTGASNDFERASQLARFMVGAYGMSDLGPISIPLDEFGFPRAHIGSRLEVQFDEAWRKIISDCDEETRRIILEHKDQIIRSAKVLLDEETLTGDRFREVWNEPAPVAAEQTGANADAASTSEKDTSNERTTVPTPASTEPEVHDNSNGVGTASPEPTQ